MIQIAAQVTSIKSRVDKSWSITFSTPELSPSQMMDLGSMNGKECVLGINLNAFTQSEEKLIDEIKIEDGLKSKSQWLRGILYRNWEVDNKGFKTFTLYYDNEMEIIGNHYKHKLP